MWHDRWQQCQHALNTSYVTCSLRHITYADSLRFSDCVDIICIIAASWHNLDKNSHSLALTSTLTQNQTPPLTPNPSDPYTFFTIHIMMGLPSLGAHPIYSEKCLHTAATTKKTSNSYEGSQVKGCQSGGCNFFLINSWNKFIIQFISRDVRIRKPFVEVIATWWRYLPVIKHCLNPLQHTDTHTSPKPKSTHHKRRHTQILE